MRNTIDGYLSKVAFPLGCKQRLKLLSVLTLEVFHFLDVLQSKLGYHMLQVHINQVVTDRVVYES